MMPGKAQQGTLNHRLAQLTQCAIERCQLCEQPAHGLRQDAAVQPLGIQVDRLEFARVIVKASAEKASSCSCARTWLTSYGEYPVSYGSRP